MTKVKQKELIELCKRLALPKYGRYKKKICKCKDERHKSVIQNWCDECNADVDFTV